MAVGGSTFEGRTYDYVFDVDLRDGEPAAKVPVNLGDNPYDVADRCAETFLLL